MHVGCGRGRRHGYLRCLVVSRVAPIKTVFGVALALHGTLLLSRWEWFFKFAIDEEVSKDTTGAPGDAVGPSFDSRGVLFVDEYAAAFDQRATLTVVWTARDVMKLAAKTGFEQDEGIHAVLHKAMEGGHQWP